MLEDDLFKDSNKMIIDECLIFFFAESQTLSMAHSDKAFYLIRDPSLM